MNLSKSKYVKGVQCKKILWLDENKPEVEEDVDNTSIFETGNFIHEVAKYLFGDHINIDFSSNLNDMVENTKYTIESYKNIVITEASFKLNNNFCSVDILKKNGNKYEMYEVKGSTSLSDVYICDASYQYHILNSLGLNVDKCYIVYLNNKYERKGDLDLDKLFIKQDVTNDVKSLQKNVKKNIDSINEYMSSKLEKTSDIDNHCYSPYPCPYFKYCTKDLPHPNVFDITKDLGATSINLYKQGYLSFEDLLSAKIKKAYKRRIEFELYNKPDYVDEENIKAFLDTLTYPLYFLDFETYQTPIPLYEHVHPYDQLPFQYSLHYYEKENGDLKHTEYLGTPGTDPRRDLALQLVNDIPLNVCTLVYHMSFEKGVIHTLANIYPDLKEHLLNIHDNIKDLEDPFKKGYYYTRKMDGSSSIKKVLPALYPDDPSLDYHNLDLIHNGSEAMNSFKAMENMTKEELEYTRERLLKYCELDTYAMVKIYKYLKKL